MFFPASNGQPVRIYLTNPIADGAWERLLTYWFKVAEWEYNPNTASATTRSQLQGGGFGDFDKKLDLLMLCDLLDPHTVKRLEKTRSGQAIFGLIANIAGGNGLFEIYYLKIGRSYGVLRADPPRYDIRETQDANMEHNADWERIHVQDKLTDAYLAKNYMKHFAILKPGPSLPTIRDDHVLGVRTGKNAQQVIKEIPLMMGPPPNTPSTTQSGQVITKTSILYDMTGISPVFTFKFKDTGKSEKNNFQPGSGTNMGTGRKKLWVPLRRCSDSSTIGLLIRLIEIATSPT